MALGKADAVRVIDGFIEGFEQALSDRRVRMDNPADFNTMLRLKEFLLGDPDARQEVHASLSLEELQRRHARMMSLARTPTSSSSQVCFRAGAGSRTMDAKSPMTPRSPPSTVRSANRTDTGDHDEDDDGELANDEVDSRT